MAAESEAKVVAPETYREFAILSLVLDELASVVCPATERELEILSLVVLELVRKARPEEVMLVVLALAKVD